MLSRGQTGNICRHARVGGPVFALGRNKRIRNRNIIDEQLDTHIVGVSRHARIDGVISGSFHIDRILEPFTISRIANRITLGSIR